MAEQRKIQLEIIIRSKEAQAAAKKLQEAEDRAKAAQISWDAKMVQIREAAKRAQEQDRIEVIAKITSGAEAARIQAEARLRAKVLRETAYKQAMAQAVAMKEAWRIQVSAMEKARSQASRVKYAAEVSDKKSMSGRWSSIWYEAYQNYRSKAAVMAQQRKEEQLIVKASQEINAL